MKKSVLVIAVLGALSIAPAALAKELTVTAVCGPSGCAAVTPAVKLSHDGITVRDAPLGGYYVVRIGLGDGTKIFERTRMYFVPAAGALAWADTADPNATWLGMSGEAAARVRKAASGLKPFTVATPTHAYVGTHRTTDAAAYVALLGRLERTAAPVTGESPIVISLYWKQPNPWSSSAALIQYLPEAGIVIRNNGYYRAPGSLADRARRQAAGLPPRAPGGGFPWGPVAGGIAGFAVVLGALTFVAWRRRHAPAPEGAVAT